MAMNFQLTFTFMAVFVTAVFCCMDDDPEFKGRLEKIRTAFCSTPPTAEKIDRFNECEILFSLVGEDLFNQCHTESLGVKSLEEGVKKSCASRVDELKEFHHKMMNCVQEKGKDAPTLKDWEEKKKSNKEEFKKERKEQLLKSMSCKEHLLGIPSP